ncbi:hypothetical protein D9758_014641 [Tetrapyrgos nigripes]|uniref:Uncharacterized protein n=1 Tax=Tetrapyrgos nigripes TaxID=182062 RepID=A0A8H5CVP2_9AGAR|nr:hypothetical protein D9758_014641 [Tetrapyrgos nigripes]
MFHARRGFVLYRDMLGSRLNKTEFTSCSIRVVFPIMLNQLIPRIGFGPAVRATAYIVLGCVTIGLALMRAQCKPANIKLFFADISYMSTEVGALITTFGFYFPIIFLQLHSVQHQVDDSDNVVFYAVIVIMNCRRIIATTFLIYTVHTTSLLEQRFGPS